MQVPSLREYLRGFWALMESKAMLWIVLYSLLNASIGSVSTTAGGEVKQVWAGVKNLQNQLFSIVGMMLFAYGLWLTKKYYLNASWKRMLVGSARPPHRC